MVEVKRGKMLEKAFQLDGYKCHGCDVNRCHVRQAWPERGFPHRGFAQLRLDHFGKTCRSHHGSLALWQPGSEEYSTAHLHFISQLHTALDHRLGCSFDIVPHELLDHVIAHYFVYRVISRDLVWYRGVFVTVNSYEEEHVGLLGNKANETW